LLKAQEAVDLTRQIYDIRRSNLELITLRYESGLEHKGALLTAQANLAQAVFDTAQNNRALEVVQRALAKELGRTRFSPVRVDGAFEVSDTVLEKPDFDALAQHNPQIGKSAAQRNAASFGVKSAEASFYPQLSARGGADRTSGHWPPDNDRWNAGIALTLPIFEGGLRVAEVAQAKALLNQAVESERSIKDGIVVALEQTWAALQDALETVGVQEKFLNAAEERAKIAEAQYSTGFITFDNWIIIINDLVSAKSSFLDTRANALFAEAEWIRAKGETLEYAHK